MNLSTKLKQAHIDIQERLVVAMGRGCREGEGMTGSLGLADANNYT